MSPDPSIQRSIEKFQAGIEREQSFRCLFERHYRLVRFHFRRHGVSLDEAEDLTQETFLRVYRALDEFRRESGFVTWLLRIADNVLLYARRSSQPRGGWPGEPVSELGRLGLGDRSSPWHERFARPGPDPLDDVLGRERYRQVLEELRSMPAQMRQCVSLRLFQGLKYREIARVLQISLDSVRVQLSRARRRLRETLDPELSERGSG